MEMAPRSDSAFPGISCLATIIQSLRDKGTYVLFDKAFADIALRSDIRSGLDRASFGERTPGFQSKRRK
jgi:hypothetical protein